MQEIPHLGTPYIHYSCGRNICIDKSIGIASHSNILVVGDRVEEVVVARVKARMHHGTGYTQHSSSAILDLNIQLAIAFGSILNLVLEWISSWNEWRRSIISSRQVLRSASVLARRHGNKLSQGTEQSNLYKSEGRDVGQGRETHTVLKNLREGVVSGQVKRSRESHSKLLNRHTNEGSHGNTSMLDLYGTTTGELIRGGALNETKGIVKIQRTGVNSEAVRRTSIEKLSTSNLLFVLVNNERKFNQKLVPIIFHFSYYIVL